MHTSQLANIPKVLSQRSNITMPLFSILTAPQAAYNEEGTCHPHKDHSATKGGTVEKGIFDRWGEVWARTIVSTSADEQCLVDRFGDMLKKMGARALRTRTYPALPQTWSGRIWSGWQSSKQEESWRKETMSRSHCVSRLYLSALLGFGRYWSDLLYVAQATTDAESAEAITKQYLAKDSRPKIPRSN